MTETFDFRPQSRNWAAFRVVISEGVEFNSFEGMVRNIRLSQKKSGNLMEYFVSPNGEWYGVEIRYYAGKVKKSDHSSGDPILALASSGSWSGGSNFKGFVFGKPGTIVWFNCKGDQKWLVFEEGGPRWTDSNPGKAPVEL